MRIVRAEVSELPLVVQMKMNMFREAGSASLLQEHAEEMILQTYSALYQEDRCCHFLVYDERGKCTACAGAVIKDDIPFCFFKTPYYGYVIDVYCVPEDRRKGYATGAMEAVLRWLKEKGVHSIKLKPSGTGRHLYERMGFCDSGEMEKWI